ncbi:MAG: SdrD B-like domain-containing protein, partial [Bacteroidota bacterium]
PTSSFFEHCFKKINTALCLNWDTIDNNGNVGISADSNVAETPPKLIPSDDIRKVGDVNFNPNCELSITVTYSENCTEPSTNNFIADWKIGIAVTDNPDNTISFQRNSEVIQAHTLTGTTDTLTISGIPADGGAADTIKVWFSNQNTCGDTIILKRPIPCPTNLGSSPGAICSAIANSEIKGTVFEDANYDGVMNEVPITGVAGIQVVLTDDCGNNVSTAYTDAGGNYQFTGLIDGTSYRVAFTLPESVSCWAKPTRAGTDNGTSIQFVQPGNCASFGIAEPGAYCQPNPNYFTTCFVPLDPINGAFASEPMGAAAPFNTNSSTKSELTFMPASSETGATYGVAWQATSQSLFVSSYMKQTAGFGPDGSGGTTTGGVYRLVADGAGNPAVSLFIDLQSLGTGSDPHPVPTDICNSMEFGNNHNACWYHDINAFGKTGKLSLGDLELTPDGLHLMTVNLNDRSLIKIPLGNDPENPVAGTPEEFDLSTLFTTCSATSDWRPFGLGKNRGMMYLGAVCSAESTQSTNDLQGLIYEFDPNNPTSFQLIFSFALNYERAGVIRSCSPPCQAYWQPWTNVESEMTFRLRTSRSGQPKADGVEPMPMISDIEFFGEDLIIGVRDRASDMIGDDAGSPFDYNSNRLYSEVSAGDLLRAARNPDGSFVLENNGITGNYTSAGVYSGGTSPGNLNTGPGGKEFYNDGFGVHSELSLGGLAQMRGNETLVLSALNPFPQIVSSAGVAAYNNTTGTRTTGNIYFDRDDPFDFGKNSGLGDVELMCQLPPIEIGNYIWEDTDGDGIQDACESGLEDVRVELYSVAGVLLAFDTTDAKGQYYFSNSNATDQYWIAAQDSVEANTTYFIVVGRGDFVANEMTIDTITYELTLDSTDAGANRYSIDSDAEIVTSSPANAFNNLPAIEVRTGDWGNVDHSFDVGFIPQLPYDYGDLPDLANGTTGINDYETYDSTGGPSHQIIAGLFLGDTVDVDNDGLVDVNALGDDNDNVDDEDGVIIPTKLNLSPSGTIRLPLSVTNTTTDTAYLEAWVDWNGDGDFEIINERVANLKDNGDGVFPAHLEINVPPNTITASSIGFRVRLSNSNNMTPYGRVNSGEVEDYLLTVNCPETVCPTVEATIKKK